MKTRLTYLLWLLICLSSLLSAQVKTTAIQKLALDESREWTAPLFSPDGKRIYCTASGFNGIWEYTLASESLRLITDDQRSGFGYAISLDGSQLSYRRTTIDAITHERTQHIVLVDLATLNSTVLESGETISTPTFVRNSVIYSVGIQLKNLSPQISAKQVSIIGIENTKIALNRYGRKVILDPLKGGSYIWPSLSPNGKQIVAYDMEAGTFICDLEGNPLANIGRRDAPTWTRDGKWIVFMRDADDGHNITSSDIWCVSTDGKILAPLTETDSVIEMYPVCSPVENKIVCATLQGELFLISYDEVHK